MYRCTIYSVIYETKYLLILVLVYAFSTFVSALAKVAMILVVQVTS
jgi:hypothetical protein